MGIKNGSVGADRLVGGAGNDWFIGWGGDDLIRFDRGGDDVLLLGRGHGVDTVTGWGVGDRVVVSGFSERQASWHVTDRGVELHLGLGGGADGVVFAGAASVEQVRGMVHLVADDWFA